MCAVVTVWKSGCVIVGTVGNIVCVLWLLYGTVDVCFGYCRGQGQCAEAHCREQLLCAVGTVENIVCVLWFM